MSMIPGGPLTVEKVDENLPLQEPGGAAEKIKQYLVDGNLEEAERLYQFLRAFDQGQVEDMADEICELHQLPVFDLDVLRAVRLGLQAGIQHGRREGANVLKTLHDASGESNG
jgi:hypothetical protein